jgi:uncharacterized repeat protein (TIGR01451 family)
MKTLSRSQTTRALFVSLVIFSLAASGIGANAATSAPEEPLFLSGPEVIIRASYSDTPKRVPPPQGFSVAAAKSAVITVNYNGVWDAAAQAAFQYAVDIWASQINSAVPIVVEAHWSSLGPGILGSAGSEDWAHNFPGAPRPATWYPIALANALAGADLTAGVHEINARFNRDFSDWYFGTDGNTPISKWDFASVVLHELGHGLGFAGSMIVDNACGGVGFGCWGWGSGEPFIYDRFTENGAGQQLITTFTNGSASLGSQLQSGSIFFDGPNTNAANGGNRAQLYAPGSWVQGSSYSHLDEVFNNTPNALMTYSIDNGESIHDPGPVMRGMFQDMGWTFTTVQMDPDLSLEKRIVGGPRLAPGDPVTFTLSIENGGTAAATGVVVTDTLSTEILSPSWIASGALTGTTARGGAPYVWDLPDLAPGAAGTLTIFGTINPGLSAQFAIVNQASVATADQESDESNNVSAAIIGGWLDYLPLVVKNAP